jgi:hypothetical protein
MDIEVIDSIDVEIDEDALMRRVRVQPDTSDAETFGGLLQAAREVARPKLLIAEAFVDAKGEDTVTIEGTTFTSRMLRKNLDTVGRVFPFVATCGHEMDEVSLSADEFLAEFWWDEIKATVLNCASASLRDRLKQRYLLETTSGMHPGSGDVDVWPIEQQEQLFGLFGDVQGLIGVELTPSFLMVPNKSLSGIRFPTEQDFRSCQVCRREKCPNRAAEFDEVLWKSIQQPQ